MRDESIDIPARLKVTCTDEGTHHHACDCREANFQRLTTLAAEMREAATTVLVQWDNGAATTSQWERLREAIAAYATWTREGK